MSSSSCVPGERSCLKANLGLFGGCDQDVISGKRKFKYFQRTTSWNPGPLQLFPTTWCWAGREVWCVILAMPSKSPNREGVCGGAIYMCAHMHMCAPFSSLPLWNTVGISREGGVLSWSLGGQYQQAMPISWLPVDRELCQGFFWLFPFVLIEFLFLFSSLNISCIGFFVLFLLSFKFIFLIEISLQCCVNFWYTAERFSLIYLYILFQTPFHCGLSQEIDYRFLFYAVVLYPCYI